MHLARWIAQSPEQRLESITRCGERDSALFAMGDQVELLASTNPADAIHAGNVLIEVAQTVAAVRAGVRARRATAMALTSGGRAEEAIAVAEDAAQIAEAHGFVVDGARALVASLAARTMLGRTEDALRIGSAARNALAQANELVAAARADLNLANIHKARGEHEAAVTRLRAAEPELRADRIPSGFIQNALGENFVYLDEFAQAERAFQTATSLLTGTPATMALAVVQGNAGDLYAREGRIQDALDAYRSARALLPESAAAHRIRLEIEEAELHVSIGAIAEGVTGLSQALEQATQLKLSSERVRASIAMARVHLSLVQLAEADAVLLAAFEELARNQDTRSLREAALTRAVLLLLRGEYSEATNTINLVLEDDRVVSSERARALVIHADALRRMGDMSNARVVAQRAVELARESGTSVLEADALIALADVVRGIDGARASIALLEQAVRAVERVRGTLVSDRYRAGWLGSRLRPYEDLALDLLSLGDNGSRARALEVVEQAKSRALLDAMIRSVDRVKSPEQSETAQGLHALRAKLNALYAADFRGSQPGTRRGASSLVSEIREIEAQYGRLSDQSTGGLRGVFATPVPIASILARVPSQAALIEYFSIGDELIVFVATERGLSVTRALASMTAADELVSRLTFHLRRGARPSTPREQARHNNAAHQLLTTLGEILVSPVFEQLGGVTRLIIVPHGSLHALPFAALVVAGAHLIEQFEVMSAPCASVALGRARPQQELQSRHPLVVAVADARAPLITQEGEFVAAALRDLCGGCDVLAGASATASEFADACSNRPIIHVACHGRFVDSLPSASGLRLADRWFPVRDILSLHLDAELVVLSACETGRHAVEAGDELNGLARAFIAAGAHRLLVSHWSASDPETMEIQKDFHRLRTVAIRAGASLVDADCSALRDSLLRARASGVQLPMWAPFALLGLATTGETPVIGSRS